MSYDKIKSLRVVAVIYWMVGLLYLLRLIVCHNNKKKTEIDVTFFLMEYSLLKYITKPALIITYLFGIILTYEDNYLLV